jgi:hypothetical protein
MIICSSSNIDLIQGVTGYGTAADGATDWRIENTATGVFNILNSPNLLAPNVSIIDAGNVGVGTIPVSGTNKLQVQGNANVSGDTLSKTYTATNTTAGTNDILTMRYDTTNGIRFQQTVVAANDVRYDVIQKTNNVDYTTPVISFYKGNVGIGTTNPNAELQITCASTATNPDTGGTIIGLYVHNPTNTATQNSVIYNRIAGSSAGKVIYAFNVAGSYGCSMVINGSDTTDRLLRFNSSSDASGTDLMVINNSNGNVSIGNTTTATHKLNVTGSVNVSGGFLVGGVALKPATAGLADTATALATTRNIAGVGFNGSGAIDIPYFNLTNKITAGNGISLSSGTASSSPTISTNLTAGNGISISAAASPSISTNLTAGNGITISAAASPVITANITAGTNITFTGTNPISISAAGGTASQWVTTGNNIYYNTGNVGIGNSTIESSYKFKVEGNVWITNQLAFFDLYKDGGGANFACNKLAFYNAGNTPTTSANNGIGVAAGGVEYFSGTSHMFYTGTTGGTGYGTERLRIASNGNIGIGTNNPGFMLEVGAGVVNVSMTGSYFNSAGVTTNQTVAYNNICAKFNNAVWTVQYYAVSSDIRIKEDIQDINDDTALQSILSIEPKTYKYVDKLQRGDKKVYGFMAQQIKDVIPEAVSIQTSYIPNIYLVADYNSCIITLSSQPTKVIIKINDKIKCYDKDNKELLVEVIEVIDTLTFRIKEIEYTDTKIFVYGTFVDDFHTLNKDYIFTLNVCATQELHRRMEAQNVVIKSQDNRIKDLEMKMERLLSGTT